MYNTVNRIYATHIRGLIMIYLFLGQRIRLAGRSRRCSLYVSRGATDSS